MKKIALILILFVILIFPASATNYTLTNGYPYSSPVPGTQASTWLSDGVGGYYVKWILPTDYICPDPVFVSPYTRTMFTTGCGTGGINGIFNPGTCEASYGPTCNQVIDDDKLIAMITYDSLPTLFTNTSYLTYLFYVNTTMPSWINSSWDQKVHFNPNGLPYPPTVGSSSYATPSAGYMIGNFSSLQGVGLGSSVLVSVSNYINTTLRKTDLYCNVSGSQTTLENTMTFQGYSSQFPLTFPNRPAVCYLQETTYQNLQCDQNSCTQMYAVGGSGTINQTPIADFDINFVTCDPIGAEFFDNTTFATSSTGRSWLWEFGDGATATTQDAAHTFPSTDTYNVKLTVSDSFGTSDVTKPVSLSACSGSGLYGNITYYFPVTIIDAITGNAIGNSTLSVAEQNTTLLWYNRTSITGKFNVTGKGSYGGVPIMSGDTLIFVGNATGYINNGFAIYATPDSNTITQYIPLIKTEYQPLNTEFTMIANAYDANTSSALSGVFISVNGGIPKSTSSGGSAIFYNLTPDVLYSLTATKTGYTTITKTFSGTNGSVLGIDIPMSLTSVNPTVTFTTVGTTAVVTTNPPPTTIPPTGTVTGGGYGGFFGPWYNAFTSMGAKPIELNLLMAALITAVFALIGLCTPGFINPMTGFSASGGLIGGVIGFLFATMFGLINPLYLILLIIFGVFLYFFFGR